MKNGMAGKQQWPVLKPDDRRLNVGDGGCTVIEAAGGMADETLPEGGRPARVTAAFADLYRRPGEGVQYASGNGQQLEAQILHGEEVRSFERHRGYVFVQAVRDGYTGWTAETNLAELGVVPTHWITAPRTFLYSGPDLKLPRSGYRSMGSLVAVTCEAETRGTRYLQLSDGSWMFAGHAAGLGEHAGDFVSVALRFLNTPYLWGGNTGFGIDCSGLVQLSMRMAGINVLRDSDMQAATIGEPVDPGTDYEKLQRGDLVFWRGHVAICEGRDAAEELRLLHANGATMDVTSEPLGAAIARIAHLFEAPIGVRRPSGLSAKTD
jgi:cell wall-associated NlpC family hydrolase